MKYYCIGIKGSGMSTLAQILFDLGNEVSGYDDVKDVKFTQEGLDKRGIKIYYDQSHEIDKDSIVTYSAAFAETHPELKRVNELGLKIKSYNDLLGDLTLMFPTICVCGTHGKTTTTTMISHILKNTIGCNYFIGDGTGFASKENKIFALESCEFKKHFLAYHPNISVVTNIELEHTECYDGIDDIVNTFNTFVNKSNNCIIACGDDDNVRKLKSDKEIIYYGFKENNDYIAKNIKYTPGVENFDFYHNDEFLGNFSIPLNGEHMVLDAMAAMIACNKEGVPFTSMNELLKDFKNAKNRFKEEFIDNNVIVNDYAHHPTEIRVTLEAARRKYPDKELIAIFKPNTYSRTKEFKDDFAKVLNMADKAYITPIECNREDPKDYDGVSSNDVLVNLKNGEMISEKEIDKLSSYENAVLCFMSCADVSHLIENYKEMKKMN